MVFFIGLNVGELTVEWFFFFVFRVASHKEDFGNYSEFELEFS